MNKNDCAHIALRARDTWTALGIKAEQTSKKQNRRPMNEKERDSPKKIVNNFIA